MTEAARAACAAAFKNLDVDAIEAGAQPANAASIRVLEKLGMQPTGERLVFAPARARYEPCAYFEMRSAGSLLAYDLE
jgi:RimJ/RimL family protein N-acetyltransferase